MDDQPIECPWCEEISYQAVRKEQTQDGKEFVWYECSECPCVGSF